MRESSACVPRAVEIRIEPCVDCALKQVMKARQIVLVLAAMAPQATVLAVTSPSDADGPVRLLTCSVSPTGLLEAQVDSRTDDAMSCSIRCSYELGDRKFSHTFSVTIPGRFQGRVGKFDTSGAKAGNYSGDVGTCKRQSS